MNLGEPASGATSIFFWTGTDEGATREYPSKLMIAGVSRSTAAAGLALAAWYDLRIVDESAVFGVFCQRFGGPMPNGPTIRRPRLIGQSRAIDLMSTARVVDANEA